MAVNLTKGQKVDLTKTNPGLQKLTIGLGWNPRRTDGQQFDLDASAFLVKGDGKVRDEKDMVFYGNKSHESNCIIHGGDNRDGQGEGDDEKMNVDLALVPADIDKIVVSVTIHEASERGQNFGMVDGAYVRIVDESKPAGQQEILRYDLSEDASTNTAMIFARLYRKDGEWKFEAVGQGYNAGLKGLCTDHGIQVEG
jgi:tellurium resistance protein TerD